MRRLPLEVGAPTWEGTLDVDGHTHHIRLTLPPGYPTVPPEVRELEGPGGRTLAPVGAPNRFPDGLLCLFPHGNDPQGWHPGRLAVDAVEQCIRMFHRDHTQPPDRSQAFFGRERLILSPGAAQVLLLPRGWGSLALRRAGPAMGDLFVALSTENATGQSVPGLDKCWFDVLKPAGEALWVRCPLGGRPWADVLRDSLTLRTLLREALPEALAERAQGAELLVLVREETEGVDAVAIRRTINIGVLQLGQVVIGRPDALLFNRVDGVLGQRERLAEVQAVLVGVGSLGGAVALALARAGVRRFVLIDPDVLSIENISRHIGTVRDLGLPKVDVVKAAIRAINPEAEVEAIPRWLAWDRQEWGAGLDFEQALAWPRGSLVITTCAVGGVERQVNAVTVRRDVPSIYAAALGAAEHGRIFRVMPGESACYECVRLAQSRDPEAFPPYAAEAAHGGRPYLQPSLPGLFIDIGQIALITARLALQTIARVHGLDLGFADEVGDHLLWTNRGGWGFDRPLQIEVVRVPRAADCPVCGGAHPAEGLTPDEQAELERLLERPMPPAE